MTNCREFAPAKINLTLHVTGQRADGYHLLDSLVVFAEVGDWVSVSDGPLSLAISGPQTAALPVTDDNLVLRAARTMGVQACIKLEKHLPIASGIGGGSADAAACLRALTKLTGEPLPGAAVVLALGADVPVCLAGRPVRMQGVGEVLAPVSVLPAMFVVLVNPGVAVATPSVFKALLQKDNPVMQAVPECQGAAEFAVWLAKQRNDLEAPAQELAPVIGGVKAALAAQAGCLLARMSGSGATCFGLFATADKAETARITIARQHPEWWCAAGAMRP